MEQNPFGILRLSPAIVAEFKDRPQILKKIAEVHRKYLQSKYHPDISIGGVEVSRALNQAVQLISDPEKRDEYIRNYLDRREFDDIKVLREDIRILMQEKRNLVDRVEKLRTKADNLKADLKTVNSEKQEVITRVFQNIVFPSARFSSDIDSGIPLNQLPDFYALLLKETPFSNNAKIALANKRSIYRYFDVVDSKWTKVRKRIGRRVRKNISSVSECLRHIKNNRSEIIRDAPYPVSVIIGASPERPRTKYGFPEYLVPNRLLGDHMKDVKLRLIRGDWLITMPYPRRGKKKSRASVTDRLFYVEGRVIEIYESGISGREEVKKKEKPKRRNARKPSSPSHKQILIKNHKTKKK